MKIDRLIPFLISIAILFAGFAPFAHTHGESSSQAFGISEAQGSEAQSCTICALVGSFLKIFLFIPTLLALALTTEFFSHLRREYPCAQLRRYFTFLSRAPPYLI